MKTVYGPVPSWRLGRSLGIDPICSKNKICSFDCAYCQLGKTKIKTIERKEYVDVEHVAEELNAADKNNSDVITFSGTGEPTLNSKIGEMIANAKRYGLKVAILTNSSLFYLKKVRESLNNADIVCAKLDAPNQKLFQKINRPVKEISFGKMFEGLKAFRKSFKGKFALQMMFIDSNKSLANGLAELAHELDPDEVQLDTPLRHSAVPPLSEKDMEKIEWKFRDLNFISVYKAKKPQVAPFDINETKIRRPL
ncbi:radical SAM protein [Candidatus Micrarchaeota archaeon]|nr:radical SAM protein [Candidatus Micrarchaeota archaeon]